MLLKVFSLIAVLIFTLTCQRELPDNAHLLNQYVEAANNHDFEILTDLIAENAVWHMVHDIRIGREEILRPLRFDEVVNTKLYVKNVEVRGDTVDFDLVEKNDVLYGLGLDSLTHFGRFVYSDSKIVLKTFRYPPEPYKTYSDTVVSFFNWLRNTDSLVYSQVISEDGKFQYSKKVGEIILAQIPKWRNRNK